VIDKEPSNESNLSGFLTTAYREKGNYLRAIEIEEKAALLRGENPDQVKTKYAALREAYNLGGPQGYWHQLLESSNEDESNPVELAALHARVGNKDKAFDYLKLAFERIPTGLVMEINMNPAFENLRSDGRFAEVLKKLRLGK